jgi:hypothetical protein
VRLLFTSKWNARFEFADTEAEARALISRLRAKQAAAKG